jgi:quercetin dioxygenase-like cupin family protein
MNVQELHAPDKEVSTKMLFAPTSGKVIAMQILAEGHLKAHQTPAPALLVLITGNVVFENENGMQVTLLPGDYVEIEANVKHWVKGLQLSQLLLIQ